MMQQENELFHCIGCGKEINWDGSGLFSYTCPCDGRIFVNNESGAPAFPAATLIALYEGKPLPHLDFLVGNSDYTSEEKTECIAALRAKGAIWMQECPQCQKDGTLASHTRRLKYERLRQEVHRRVDLGELSSEEAIEDLMLLHKQEKQEAEAERK